MLPPPGSLSASPGWAFVLVLAGVLALLFRQQVRRSAGVAVLGLALVGFAFGVNIVAAEKIAAAKDCAGNLGCSIVQDLAEN